MTYRDRREAKAERLTEWAAKREAKATAAYETASRMGEAIPFGQPILVGHHSEGRDRRYRDRIVGAMDRSRAHATKAQDMSRRAEGIKDQLAASIYSDDENAVEALQARIAGLEAERDRIKAYNATCRKGTPNTSLLTDTDRADLAVMLRHAAFQCKNGAFPAYKLSNLNGNLKRNRDRLAVLTQELTS